MAIGIGHSFALHPSNALPQYHTSTPINTQPTHLSGESTKKTDPPYFATSLLMDDWVAQGNTIIHPILNDLNQEFIAQREDCMHHSSEADVVRAATLHLIHPINQALSASLHFRQHGEVKCFSELTTNRIRSDVVFYANSQASEARAFAVLEFKKRNVIRRHEFQNAEKVITQRTPEDYHIHAAQRDYQPPTFFQGNSLTLMKQAASYAIRHETRYVALFNWDFLVLIRFVCMPQGLDQDALQVEGVGNFCQITLIPYNPQSHVMRAALLGFLAEAYRVTLS